MSLVSGLVGGDYVAVQFIGDSGDAGYCLGYIIHLQSHIAVLDDFAVYICLARFGGSIAVLGP